MSRFFSRGAAPISPSASAANPESHSSTTPAVNGEKPRQGFFADFSLVLWLRLHGVDLITMALMGALGLGVYMAPPAPSRSFPLTAPTTPTPVYPEFSYPLRKNIIPIWLAAFLAFFIPWFFFTLFQLRRRSANDYLNTIMGLLKSLITAAVFQVFIKWLIGGLRPHFLDVCKPDPGVLSALALETGNGTGTGNGFQGIMYDRRVCTGDEKQINDALESMPSGHSTAAFAGFIYLALYMNAQLKVISAHNPAYWKMILFFAPILGAVLIAGSLTIDEFHHWYDVVMGAAIGTSCALIAFRQTFASIFDFRFNHILLPRTSSLFLRVNTSHSPHANTSHPYPYNGGVFYSYDGFYGVGRTENMPFTREGGWRADLEGFVGAPGDATVLIAGGRGVGGASARSNGAVGHERV